MSVQDLHRKGKDDKARQAAVCESVSTSPPEVVSKRVKTASIASSQNIQKPLAKII